MFYEIIASFGPVNVGSDDMLHFGRQSTKDSEYGGSLVIAPFSVSKDALVNFSKLGYFEKLVGMTVPKTLYGVGIKNRPFGGVSITAFYELSPSGETVSVLSKTELDNLIAFLKSDQVIDTVLS